MGHLSCLRDNPVSRGVAVGSLVGVLVGTTGVSVGGIGVSVGSTGVSVGSTGVSVGSTGVSVGGIGVSVGVGVGSPERLLSSFETILSIPPLNVSS